MDSHTAYDSFRAEIRGLIRESERQQTVGATLDEQNALIVHLDDALERLYVFSSRNLPAGQIDRRRGRAWSAAAGAQAPFTVDTADG